MPSKRCVFIVISNLFWEAYEIWKDMTMIENLWEQFQHSAHLSEAPNTSVREDRLFSKQYQFWVLNFIHTSYTFQLTSVSDQNRWVELSNTHYCFSAKQDIHGTSINIQRSSHLSLVTSSCQRWPIKLKAWVKTELFPRVEIWRARHDWSCNIVTV